jgi:predicted ATPase/DNA-binding SARP family transcriptional activator
MAARCRVELFGGLRIVQGDRAVSRFRTRKTAALLAYLAYYPSRSHPREALIEMLWPWANPAAGRHSLSCALTSLRHQLEPPGVPVGTVIMADRQAVGLNPESVTTDVAEFEAALAASKTASGELGRIQLLTRAVQLYRGELLAGLLEDWITQEQLRLSERCVAALVELTSLLSQRGDHVAAIDNARRAIQIDPLREEPYRETMRLHAAAGETAAALRVYRELETVYQRELQEKPSRVARELARELERLAGPASAQETAQPAKVQGPAARPSAQRRRAPAKLPLGTASLLLLKLDAFRTEAVLAGVRREVRHYGGAELEGDDASYVATFPRAGDAVACAAACRRALEQPLRYAVHTSDVEADGGTLQHALQRACRIADAAHPRQILCSEATSFLLRQDLNGGLSLRGLGVHRFLDAPAPEHLFQVDDGIVPADFPPLKAESAYANRLPLQLTRFFGRQMEIASLRELLLRPDTRMVTLLGPPGSGKTRLAVETVRGLLEEFRGAVWWVSLIDLQDASGIPQRTLEALGGGASPADPIAQVVRFLAGRPSLLVFDNFEHLLAGVDVLTRLLRELPDLTCLVTSRQRLGLRGEREFRVDPLPVPELHIVDPEELLRCASVQLFVDRAQGTRPDFQVTAANGPVLGELCRRLEGVPLALELAAARAQVMSPAQIAKHLALPLELLKGRHGDPFQHSSLRAALEWSFALLPRDGQRCFMRLAVFRGGWTAEAAEAVCEDPMVLDHLAQLVECSLVQVEHGLEEPRFRMLEMVRHFAAERLEGSGTAAAVRILHLDYYHKRVEGFRGREERDFFKKVAADHDNFLAALVLDEPKDKVEDQMCMADILTHYWSGRDPRLGFALYCQIIERDRDSAPRYLRAQVLGDAGLLAEDLADYPRSRTLVEEALKINRALDKRGAIAGNLCNLANVEMRVGNYSSARSLLEEALAINRGLGNRSWEAVNLNNLGAIALEVGDYALARTHFELAVVIHRELGNWRSLAIALSNLGSTVGKLGDNDRARELLEESLSISREIGHRSSVAQDLTTLADVDIVTGNHAAASARLIEVLGLIEELGLRGEMDEAFRHAARVVCGTSDGRIASTVTIAALERAARLQGVAEYYREELGITLYPAALTGHERFLAELNEKLGKDRFARARDSGRAMSFEDAIRFATDGLLAISAKTNALP